MLGGVVILVVPPTPTTHNTTSLGFRFFYPPTPLSRGARAWFFLLRQGARGALFGFRFGLGPARFYMYLLVLVAAFCAFPSCFSVPVLFLDVPGYSWLYLAVPCSWLPLCCSWLFLAVLARFWLSLADRLAAGWVAGAARSARGPPGIPLGRDTAIKQLKIS